MYQQSTQTLILTDQPALISAKVVDEIFRYLAVLNPLDAPCFAEICVTINVPIADGGYVSLCSTWLQSFCSPYVIDAFNIGHKNIY